MKRKEGNGSGTQYPRVSEGEKKRLPGGFIFAIIVVVVLVDVARDNNKNDDKNSDNTRGKKMIAMTRFSRNFEAAADFSAVS